MIGADTGVSEFFPIYNLVAAPGVAASFGANVLGANLYLTARVRSGGDYGVTVEARNINQTIPWIDPTITLWVCQPTKRTTVSAVGFSTTSTAPAGFCNGQSGDDRSVPHSWTIPPKPC